MFSSRANTEHCNTSLHLKPVKVQSQVVIGGVDKPLTVSELAIDDNLSVIKQPSYVSFTEDTPQ